MVLKDYKIDGEYICISKKELEELAELYNNEANKLLKAEHYQWYAHYNGKRSVILDLLRMFKREED